MILYFLLKVITLKCLLVRKASSKENTAILSVEGLFETSVCKYEVKCPYIDIGQVLPQNETCCKNLTLAFECSYSYKMQLLRYLNLLKSWKCSNQLETECRLKTFNYNELTEKVYLSVCNPENFNETCEIQSPVNYNFNDSLDYFSAKKDFLKRHCTSAREFYDFGAENFVEVFSPDLPMCPVVWCGFQRNKIEKFGLSYWDCASERLVLKLFS